MQNNTKIMAIGADHAGPQLKGKMITWLQQNGWQVIDHGVHDSASVDYPDYAHLVADDVASGRAQLGVLVCGSGVGMAIAANKHKGVRAAQVYNIEVAGLAREHNDANIMTIGARFMDDETALAALEKFTTTEFAGGRHAGRVNKIEGN